jgi:hypothetical protein
MQYVVLLNLDQLPDIYFVWLQLLNGPTDIHTTKNDEYALSNFAFFFTNNK